MKDYLFVYGTLLPDQAPHELRADIARLKPISAGSMPGRIYDLSDFPGAVYDRFAQTCVHGQVFELPNDNRPLSRLDEYEECVLGQPEASLFIREKRPIALPDGSQLLCWVYLYNRDPGKSPLIPSGDYSEWTAAQQATSS
jgi:gamma-glutamylcyclotransferase (GGCT)/AIG2-like uncharacterized protein YtfP